MSEKDPAGRGRRFFIKDSLRLTVFGALVTTGGMLGLRKTSPESRIYQCTDTSLLSCRECSRRSGCEVSSAETNREDEYSRRWDNQPNKREPARAKK